MKTFSADELALLVAIHAGPRDDTPRLVYADWLEEHGEPEYAEFIRWQVKNPTESKIPRPSAKTRDRWRTATAPGIGERMRRALALNYGRWGRPCPSDTDLAVFSRGLPITTVRWVTGTEGLTRLLAAASPRLRFQLPLDDVTVGLLSHPIFGRADVVSLCPADLQAGLPRTAIHALAAWPGIGSLRTVRLWGVRESEAIHGLFPATVVLDINPS